MLVHEEKQADGQVVITERQIKGDEMHVVSLSFNRSISFIFIIHHQHVASYLTEGDAG